MRKPFFRDPWSWIMLCCVCMSAIAVSLAAIKWSTASDSAQHSAPTGPDADGIFAELFAQPDWEELYKLAQMQDTPFEGCRAFSAFMAEQTANKALSYKEYKAEKEDIRRYVVYCGEEKIAAWTLSAKNQWQLENLEFYIHRQNGVSVLVDQETTVYLNGVALDNAYTVETVQTKAEGYLPDDIHGFRSKLQRLDGLLMPPAVTAKDKDGYEIALVYDDQTCTYRQEIAKPFMTEQQESFIRSAAIADARFAIDEINATELAAYFDEKSDLYQMIVKCPHNIQTYIKSVIDESKIEVSSFRQYTDTLFSARVKLTQKITRTYGTIKTYQLDKTYFFTLNEEGEYRVFMSTNEDAAKEEKVVRLDFIQEECVKAQMVSADEKYVNVPQLDSENFAGWAIRTKLDNGDEVLTVRILPDGTVLGELEPMELYPAYHTDEDKGGAVE